MVSPVVNHYLITDYLYHWICMRCGAAHHRRAAAESPACPVCGCDGLWRSLGASPTVPEPVYVQELDPECPTCRKTLAKLAQLEGQLTLFEVTA
jgi:hypothetical protein